MVDLPAGADVVLLGTLRIAIPLRIAELAEMDSHRRWQVMQRWAARGAEMVAHHADKLMFRSPASKRHTKDCQERERRGAHPPGTCDCRVGTAQVFNALAKALAAGALLPGGVTFAGQHWCTNHDLCLDPGRDSAPSDAPRLRPIVDVHLPEVVNLDA